MWQRFSDYSVEFSDYAVGSCRLSTVDARQLRSTQEARPQTEDAKQIETGARKRSASEGVCSIIRRLLTTAGVLGATLVVTAAPAVAGPPTETAATTAVAAASVPGCVTFRLNDEGFTDYLTVTNGCTATSESR